MILFFFVSLLVMPLRASAETVDKIAAIVGDQIITSSDLEKETKLFKGKKMQGEVLEQLIHDALLKGEIERLQIAVTTDELSQMIGGILAQNRMTLEQLKAEIAKKQISFEQYKKGVSQNIKMMKFMGQVIYPRIKVTDEEIENYRKTNPQITSEIARRRLYEGRGQEELRRYLQEVRQKTYVDILP
ncbi:MAG: SurA N-terminal domain-containing protein [Deltaproteobacteria bacterium]|nr:SurA N-terminal domain-containing protein [Deltaproteobacteria bacterium]